MKILLDTNVVLRVRHAEFPALSNRNRNVR